ncbi:L-rhamnose mutarotase [Arundinibacter roseus]|uniref:L-rhamnose mutarotase n=1 Tax=Arundinibacter roseus TaxID=2070510 RepID=A0A4R4KFF6_9BACT|nr:L-rhamnose mutarotase [Arundinibacter roseus]TDB65259.1 L-rhamnose mutarotase [Arundinibacter roseus]
MKRYCFTLDLKDDPKLIAEYEAHHRAVWPEILESIVEPGIEQMEIYRFHTRLFMIMDVNERFNFKLKELLDENNLRVQQWEQLMWTYQQALPTAKPGEKWVLTKKIFDLQKSIA